LARVDMQRDKLASQLGELEATERVLARYSKGTQVKKTASARRPTTAKKAAAPARRHEPTTTAKAAGRKRSSSNLGDQILALATGKTQQEIAAACKGVRPNHVGAALARHKRAGLIEERDGKLYAIPSTRTDQPAALSRPGAARLPSDLLAELSLRESLKCRPAHGGPVVRIHPPPAPSPRTPGP